MEVWKSQKDTQNCFETILNFMIAILGLFNYILTMTIIVTSTKKDVNMIKINLAPNVESKTYEAKMDLIMNTILVVLCALMIGLFVSACPKMAQLPENLKSIILDVQKASK